MISGGIPVPTRVFTLGIPGYLPEYGPNYQAWYPGRVHYILLNTPLVGYILWGYPGTCPSMTKK